MPSESAPYVVSMAERSRRRVPEATVERLPIYLRCLTSLVDSGVNQVSSDQIAELAGVNAAKVRKDLSFLGTYGTRGVGYDVSYLVYQVRQELGLNHEWPVVIVGAGNLGQALSAHEGFGQKGFPVAGIVDIDASKIGAVIGGVRVRHIDELPKIVAAKNVAIGVLAVPAESAQDAAERLVRSGVTSILTFAPVLLDVPLGVTVRPVDLASELQILSYHEQRRAASGRSTTRRSAPATA